jgi:large subunit ribosomal protein L29
VAAKAREMRGLGDAELRERLEELQNELFRIRFRAATDPDVNPGRMRTLRRDIARVKTILRERELARAREARTDGNG